MEESNPQYNLAIVKNKLHQYIKKKVNPTADDQKLKFAAAALLCCFKTSDITVLKEVKEEGLSIIRSKLILAPDCSEQAIIERNHAIIALINAKNNFGWEEILEDINDQFDVIRAYAVRCFSLYIKTEIERSNELTPPPLIEQKIVDTLNDNLANLKVRDAAVTALNVIFKYKARYPNLKLRLNSASENDIINYNDMKKCGEVVRLYAKAAENGEIINEKAYNNLMMLSLESKLVANEEIFSNAALALGYSISNHYGNMIQEMRQELYKTKPELLVKFFDKLVEKYHETAYSIPILKFSLGLHLDGYFKNFQPIYIKNLTRLIPVLEKKLYNDKIKINILMTLELCARANLKLDTNIYTYLANLIYQGNDDKIINYAMAALEYSAKNKEVEFSVEVFDFLLKILSDEGIKENKILQGVLKILETYISMHQSLPELVVKELGDKLRNSKMIGFALELLDLIARKTKQDISEQVIASLIETAFQLHHVSICQKSALILMQISKHQLISPQYFEKMEKLILNNFQFMRDIVTIGSIIIALKNTIINCRSIPSGELKEEKISKYNQYNLSDKIYNEVFQKILQTSLINAEVRAGIYTLYSYNPQYVSHLAIEQIQKDLSNSNDNIVKMCLLALKKYFSASIEVKSEYKIKLINLLQDLLHKDTLVIQLLEVLRFGAMYLSEETFLRCRDVLIHGDRREDRAVAREILQNASEQKITKPENAFSTYQLDEEACKFLAKNHLEQKSLLNSWLEKAQKNEPLPISCIHLLIDILEPKHDMIYQKFYLLVLDLIEKISSNYQFLPGKLIDQLKILHDHNSHNRLIICNNESKHEQKRINSGYQPIINEAQLVKIFLNLFANGQELPFSIGSNIANNLVKSHAIINNKEYFILLKQFVYKGLKLPKEILNSIIKKYLKCDKEITQALSAILLFNNELDAKQEIQLSKEDIQFLLEQLKKQHFSNIDIDLIKILKKINLSKIDINILRIKELESQYRTLAIDNKINLIKKINKCYLEASVVDVLPSSLDIYLEAMNHILLRNDMIKILQGLYANEKLSIPSSTREVILNRILDFLCEINVDENLLDSSLDFLLLVNWTEYKLNREIATIYALLRDLSAHNNQNIYQKSTKLLAQINKLYLRDIKDSKESIFELIPSNVSSEIKKNIILLEMNDCLDKNDNILHKNMLILLHKINKIIAERMMLPSSAIDTLSKYLNYPFSDIQSTVLESCYNFFINGMQVKYFLPLLTQIPRVFNYSINKFSARISLLKLFADFQLINNNNLSPVVLPADFVATLVGYVNDEKNLVNDRIQCAAILNQLARVGKIQLAQVENTLSIALSSSNCQLQAQVFSLFGYTAMNEKQKEKIPEQYLSYFNTLVNIFIGKEAHHFDKVSQDVIIDFLSQIIYTGLNNINPTEFSDWNKVLFLKSLCQRDEKHYSENIKKSLDQFSNYYKKIFNLNESQFLTIYRLILEYHDHYELNPAELELLLSLLQTDSSFVVFQLQTRNNDKNQQLYRAKILWLQYKLSKLFVDNEKYDHQIYALNEILDLFDNIGWGYQFANELLHCVEQHEIKPFLDILILFNTHRSKMNYSDVINMLKTTHYNSFTDLGRHLKVEFIISKVAHINTNQQFELQKSELHSLINQLIYLGWPEEFFLVLIEIINPIIKTSEEVRSLIDVFYTWIDLNVIFDKKFNDNALLIFKNSSNKWLSLFHNSIFKTIFPDVGEERNGNELISLYNESNPDNRIDLEMAKIVTSIDIFKDGCYYTENTHNKEPVQSWSKEKISEWLACINGLQFNRKLDLTKPKILKELLSVINRAIIIYTDEQSQGNHRYELRRSQVLAVISLLTEKNKGRIAQIATGEGKSLTVAVITIIHSLLQYKEDIITPSSIFAIRDANEFKKLYEIFGLTVAHNHDDQYQKNIKDCYDYKNNIVYGDASEFQFDLLRHEFSQLGTKGTRILDRTVIDEADSILLDHAAKLSRLADSMPGFDYLQAIYICIWRELNNVLDCKNQAEEKGSDFIQNLQDITSQILLKEICNKSDDIVATKIKEHLLDNINKILKLPDSKVEVKADNKIINSNDRPSSAAVQQQTFEKSKPPIIPPSPKKINFITLA